MLAKQHFGMKSILILLLACFLLTGEEAVHFFRNNPDNDTDFNTTLHHPGCTVLDPLGGILRCPVRGYGQMIFLCKQGGCLAKEPSTGLYISPAESALIRRQAF